MTDSTALHCALSNEWFGRMGLQIVLLSACGTGIPMVFGICRQVFCHCVLGLSCEVTAFANFRTGFGKSVRLLILFQLAYLTALPMRDVVVERFILMPVRTGIVAYSAGRIAIWSKAMVYLAHLLHTGLAGKPVLVSVRLPIVGSVVREQLFLTADIAAAAVGSIVHHHPVGIGVLLGCRNCVERFDAALHTFL